MPVTPTPPIVEAHGVEKTYRRGRTEVAALRGIDLSIEPGEVLFVVGPSGGGKSTLLNLVGGLDRPDRGKIVVAGTDVSVASERALDRFRRRHLGFVFQFFNLLGTLTARDNVAVALAARRGCSWADARAEANRLLDELGLGARADHRPAELSGGEQQRVAIARAVAGEPALILADEPTGNIDSAATAAVMSLLVTLKETRGVTLLIVTHDYSLRRYAGRVLEMVDGHLTASG
jgi:ABC-type lipoprotein export system ATPase subunit